MNRKKRTAQEAEQQYGKYSIEGRNKSRKKALRLDSDPGSREHRRPLWASGILTMKRKKGVPRRGPVFY